MNLEQNTFDTFKVEASLMTAFEQSQTWDELIKFFVDNYVVEQDKQKVTDSTTAPTSPKIEGA